MDTSESLILLLQVKAAGSLESLFFTRCPPTWNAHLPPADSSHPDPKLTVPPQRSPSPGSEWAPRDHLPFSFSAAYLVPPLAPTAMRKHAFLVYSLWSCFSLERERQEAGVGSALITVSTSLTRWPAQSRPSIKVCRVDKWSRGQPFIRLPWIESQRAPWPPQSKSPSPQGPTCPGFASSCPPLTPNSLHTCSSFCLEQPCRNPSGLPPSCPSRPQRSPLWWPHAHPPHQHLLTSSLPFRLLLLERSLTRPETLVNGLLVPRT